MIDEGKLTMLDFRIETFLTVCQYMNFTRAAEALNITQPAVSQHIHCLEESYGMALFRYERKRLQLTAAGEMLLQAATTMRHDDIYLRHQLKELQDHNRKLAFGVTLTIGEFVLPKPLAYFLRQNPETDVRMLVANTKELLHKIDSGEIDFALVEGFFPRGAYDSLLYTKNQYIAVCGAEYRFQREIHRVEDLLGERLLLREPGSGTRGVLEKALQSLNLSIEDFQHIAEISNINAIKALTAASCGVTFLYQAAVEKELRQGVLRKITLEDLHISHDFAFIWRRGSMFAGQYQEIFKALS